MDPVLFSFPGIRVLLPNKGTSPHEPGLLVLLREDVPTRGGTDEFLRLQFFSGSEYPAIDIRLDAYQEATKLDSSTFSINSPQGALKVIFPPVHTYVPQDDPRIDIPPSERASTTWQDVVDTFEVEIDRWLTYKKEENEKASGFGSGSGYPSEKPGGALVSRMATPAGSSSNQLATYDPSNFSDSKKEGRLVLIDEENGNEVGEVGGYQVHSIGVTPGSKDPVEIELPQNGSGRVTVRTADYLKDAMDPVYANSTIVGTAATASRLIVTTSAYIANALHSGADAYMKHTKPNTAPVTFSPTTHNRVRQIHRYSNSAAKISAQTIGQVSKHAQNLGARIVGKNQDRPERGKPANPGLFNKSLIAFSTVADGIDYASKSLLGAGANAATTVVGHKYGEEARSVAYGLTGSVKNVGLVYVDASGVSRRAIVRGVAKGMVIGKVRGGGEVVVPGNDQKIDGIPQGWGDGPLGGPYAGPPSMPGSGRNTPGTVGKEHRSESPLPPSYSSVQGTFGASGSGQGGNVYFPPPPTSSKSPQPSSVQGTFGASGSGQGGNMYFPPPPTSSKSPQPTGYIGFGDMKSVSPTPYEPTGYRAPSPQPPLEEKSPAVMHGGYRY